MIIVRTIECIGYDPNKKPVDFKILLPLLLKYKLIHYQITKQYEKKWDDINYCDTLNKIGMDTQAVHSKSQM